MPRRGRPRRRRGSSGRQQLWHTFTTVTTTTKSDINIAGKALGLEARPARVVRIHGEVSSDSFGQVVSIAVYDGTSDQEHSTRTQPILVPRGLSRRFNLRVPSITDFGYLFNQDVLNISTTNPLKNASDSIQVFLNIRMLVEYKPPKVTDIPAITVTGSSYAVSSLFARPLPSTSSSSLLRQPSAGSDPNRPGKQGELTDTISLQDLCLDSPRCDTDVDDD